MLKRRICGTFLNEKDKQKKKTLHKKTTQTIFSDCITKANLTMHG